MVNNAVEDASQVRINIRSVANASKVRREKRNGRDVIIVPAATLPDNVVMNGILYPADEIEKSYAGLERTPAPLGHPTLNGKFVSARDPEGINIGYIGAWNENVRREGGRVLMDKVIDVEVANRCAGGKKVLAAIEAGGPIHTSTGLLAKLSPVANATTHKQIARDYAFDHDAILLDEPGAATPDQGVGMLVNAEGEEQEITVINSSLTEMADQEIDFAGTRLVEALARRENLGRWERLKSAIIEAVVGTERETSLNNQENDMSVSKEQFDALSAEVKTLSESMKPDALATAIGNVFDAKMKPLTDQLTANAAEQKAKDETELTNLRQKIVAANLMDKATAGELTLNAARALAPKTEPGKAAPLANSGFKLPGSGDKPTFQLPKAEVK
ncbi:hypothetical protein ASC65_14345 [Brevundimonas sp. Root1279]|nr:hypothetical protein ASC65_14345 [Brevundimonas sp. Root1279]